MKKLLPLLALGLACCTPQRQETQHITITADDTADRKITLAPMGSRERAVDMTIEDGIYSATVNTSPTGFYNLISIKGSYQLIVPYYVPVSESESSAHLTFGEVGVPTIEGSKDNNALIAYTAAYAQKSRSLWHLPKGDAEAGRALLESYAPMADSIIKAHRCSKPVAEYIRTWAYINASEGYNSLQRNLGIPAKEMPFNCEDILPAAYTMLDSPVASLFPSTPGIIYSSIPNKRDLDSALTYVEQHYTDTTLLKKTKETIASIYVSRYNYSKEFDEGLERLQAATERYGLSPRHAEDFAKHRSAIPGQPFPEGIVLQDREGNVVDFSTFRGKYVYIDMWASWCVPCLREVPVLQELEKKLKNKKVAFVSISVDANKEAWLKKLDEKNMHGHQLWNSGSTLGSALNVKGIPFFAIYDPDGNLYMHGAPRPSQGPGLVELLEGLK